MYKVTKTSGDIYSTEESNDSNSGCSSRSSSTDAQVLLEGLPSNCQDSHPLFVHKQKNTQVPCQPKKSIIRLFFNLLVLCVLAPFCLLKKLCCLSSSKSLAQKIVSWAILLLLMIGATYMGLFEGSTYEIFGRKWEDFSICDIILGKGKDLRSLKKDNRRLQRRALEIAPVKQEIEMFQSQFHHLRSGIKGITHLAVSEALVGHTSKGISALTIKKALKKLLEKLDEDDVQMPDYALKSAGASIVQSRTTRSYHHDGGKYYWMSFIMLPFVTPPDVILQPNFYPGNCWSFPGNQGETVVRLSKNILLRAVTIDHISKTISPTGEISSAPKMFEIYALEDENEEPGTYLGKFVYNIEGNFIQTFELKREPTMRRYVKLKVLNNWGHPKYTCIYRFRVHGDL
ncbi:SUN domain-containing protein 3 [Tiliqua scincoides]|uniref:SUN domain-containing protein 3 n=1 Tax=Tiliqua scincoides TaxID=71010 RepID=UPI003461CF8E